MDFIVYTKAVYEAKLRFFETADLASLGKDKLLALTAEASAMKKFLFDNREDGYVYTFEVFERDLDAVRRLDRIVCRGTDLLGMSDESAFHLCPGRSGGIPGGKGDFIVIELGEYLQRSRRSERRMSTARS